MSSHPDRCPLAGFGNCPVLGELTTPAGGRCLALGPTTRIKAKLFFGTLSWLIDPFGSTTTPRKYFLGLAGSVTAEPVMVTTLFGWLMMCFANVLKFPAVGVSDTAGTLSTV